MPKSNLVFLDADTVDFGDLDLSPLRKLGKLTLYPVTPPSRIAQRLRNGDIALNNKCVFDAALFEKLPRLKAVALAATGYNQIDLEAARARGVQVMNVPDYSTDSVVEHTFACILALAKSLIGYNAAARGGRWSRSPHFTLGHLPNRELAGKTLGILGFGAIGRKVAKVARAFGMRVLAGKIPGRRYGRGMARRISFGELLQCSDVLTIHAPLTPLTRGLVGAAALAKMKPGALLVNMGRGGIVDERALGSALRRGKLGGAALDVLSKEPPPKNHPLFKAPNLILTPHIAWGSREARQRLIEEMAANIRAFQAGRRRNCLF